MFLCGGMDMIIHSMTNCESQVLSSVYIILYTVFCFKGKLTDKKVFRSPFDRYSITTAGFISPAEI